MGRFEELDRTVKLTAGQMVERLREKIASLEGDLQGALDQLLVIEGNLKKNRYMDSQGKKKLRGAAEMIRQRADAIIEELVGLREVEERLHGEEDAEELPDMTDEAELMNDEQAPPAREQNFELKKRMAMLAGRLEQIDRSFSEPVGSIVDLVAVQRELAECEGDWRSLEYIVENADERDEALISGLHGDYDKIQQLKNIARWNEQYLMAREQFQRLSAVVREMPSRHGVDRDDLERARLTAVAVRNQLEDLVSQGRNINERYASAGTDLYYEAEELAYRLNSKK